MEILGDDEDLFLHDPWSLDKDNYYMDSSVDKLFELLLVAEANRYIYQWQLYAKSKAFALNDFFYLPETSFLQLTRISKPSFDFIRSEIEEHAIFHNDSHKSQAPMCLQLAIILDRLGNYGSAISLGRTQAVESWEGHSYSVYFSSYHGIESHCEKVHRVAEQASKIKDIAPNGSKGLQRMHELHERHDFSAFAEVRD